MSILLILCLRLYITSIASPMPPTPMILIPSILSIPSRFTLGMITDSYQTIFASCTRCCAMLTARTYPLSPTSPNTIVRSSTARFLKLETIAMISPRSIAGSLIFMPPAMFT